MRDTTTRGVARKSVAALLLALTDRRHRRRAGARTGAAPDGAELYKRACAQCHDAGVGRAPNREQFLSMLPDRVLSAMETGSMVTMATGRSAVERRAIAEFLTGKTFATALSTTPAPRAMCTPRNAPFAPGTGPAWSGWGQNTSNTRYQSAAGLTAADVPQAQGEMGVRVSGRPAVVLADHHRRRPHLRRQLGRQGLFARTPPPAASTGTSTPVRACVRPSASGEIETAGGRRWAAFFGDQGGNAYALDATTGAQIWKTHVDDFPVARVSGSPTLYNGKLYVPVASGEEASGAVPTYECCKFRGSIVALDAATGKQVWKTYTIDEPAADEEERRRHAALRTVGRAGVGDAGDRSGEARARTSPPATTTAIPASPMSDAFVAMDLETGRILWHRQMTPNDAYTAACRLPDKTNCADSNGPDWDFGASPMLVTLPDGTPAAAGRTEVGHRPRARSRQGRRGRVADARRAGAAPWAACSGAPPPTAPTSTWPTPTSAGSC